MNAKEKTEVVLAAAARARALYFRLWADVLRHGNAFAELTFHSTMITLSLFPLRLPMTDDDLIIHEVNLQHTIGELRGDVKRLRAQLQELDLLPRDHANS